MHKDYKTLKDNNINMHSVKTNAFIIDRKNIDKAKTLIKFLTKREGGELKIINKYHHRANIYKIRVNELSEIPTYNNVNTRVKDEYDTKSICEQIVSCNPCVILGDVPGTGKSYICEYFRKLNYKVLFVVPTNFLRQQCDCESTTASKFCSISIEEDDRLPIYDPSPYNVIVFDEIDFNDYKVYCRIDKFIQEHKHNKNYSSNWRH